MDPTRDNPIIRFTAFWWAIGTFMFFALLLAVIWLFNRQTPATLEDVVARVRYETKGKIAHDQAVVLTPSAIDAAIPRVAQYLAATRPAAVERPDQLVAAQPTTNVSSPVPPVPPVPDSHQP